jgi:hypothetical protein
MDVKVAPKAEVIRMATGRLLYVTGVVAAAAVPMTLFFSGSATAHVSAGTVADVKPAAAEFPDDALVALAQRSPRELLERARTKYESKIRGYRCTLTKQERLGNKLGDIQEVELRFRDEPRAIYMLWKKNADQARRALYMEGPPFVDDKGQKLVRVEPNGAVARLFVKDTYVVVNGPEARESSRRTIDEAGFHASFMLLERSNAAAEARGVLNLKYIGTGTVDNRPTLVFERLLPYEGPSGAFPDARMVMHVDREWLLPTAVYSYADAEGKTLLGSYVFTDVQLNPDFAADAFRF